MHAAGEIWGQTLWDLRARLGSKLTERLVTRAMELSPANPSFLDMRNAIVYFGGHGSGFPGANLAATTDATGHFVVRRIFVGTTAMSSPPLSASTRWSPRSGSGREPRRRPRAPCSD